MPKLSTAAGANVPQVFRQLFPNAGARLADPTDYTAFDVNKIAVQLDTGEQYRLASIGPTVWVLITGTGSARFTPRWKAGVPGDPFVNGDTVVPDFFDRVYFTAPSGSTVDFNPLPLIAPANAGFQIGFYDTTFAAKDIGTINFTPAAGNSIGGHPNGATRKLVAGTIGPWLVMESDGNDTWTVVEGLFNNATFDAFSA